MLDGHSGRNLQQVVRNEGWNSGEMMELDVQIWNYLFKVDEKLKKELWLSQVKNGEKTEG